MQGDAEKSKEKLPGRQASMVLPRLGTFNDCHAISRLSSCFSDPMIPSCWFVSLKEFHSLP